MFVWMKWKYLRRVVRFLCRIISSLGVGDGVVEGERGVVVRVGPVAGLL